MKASQHENLATGCGFFARQYLYVCNGYAQLHSTLVPSTCATIVVRIVQITSVPLRNAGGVIFGVAAWRLDSGGRLFPVSMFGGVTEAL